MASHKRRSSSNLSSEAAYTNASEPIGVPKILIPSALEDRPLPWVVDASSVEDLHAQEVEYNPNSCVHQQLSFHFR